MSRLICTMNHQADIVVCCFMKNNHCLERVNIFPHIFSFNRNIGDAEIYSVFWWMFPYIQMQYGWDCPSYILILRGLRSKFLKYDVFLSLRNAS